MAKNEVRFVIQDKGLGRVRDELGKFIARDNAANEAAYKALAERAQGEVVKRMTNKWRRPSVSTGRLERVTASTKNRYADQYGYGVGVINYLDKSEAKYWRTIEEGSLIAWSDTPGGRSQMAGLMIRGKFGATITGWRTDPRTGDPRPRVGPKWNVPRGGFQASGLSKLPYVEVKEEIRPQHAYRSVFTGTQYFKKAPQAVITSYLRQAARRAIKGR